MAGDDLANLCRELAALSATIAERDRRVDEQFIALRHINEQNHKTLDARLASVNEFRALVSDQQAHFARKEELEVRFTELARRLNAMDEKRDAIGMAVNSSAGVRAGTVSAWTWLAGAIAAIATIIVILDRVPL